MNSEFINTPSGFSIGDAVTVSMTYHEKGKDGRFCGMVYSNDMLPINTASGLGGGSTEYIYVSFHGRAAYDMWLLQGSAIKCTILGKTQECVVRTIQRSTTGEITSMSVSIALARYTPFPYEYKVDINKVVAMLVWRVAYQIEATA